MLDLPSQVLDYIGTHILEIRSPAYLLVKQGCLVEWGGKLAGYGVTNLQAGNYVGEQVFFLEGLLPLDDCDLFLSCVQTEYGICADIHIFSGNQGDWVLILDATLDKTQRRSIQQQRNELGLLQEKARRSIKQVRNR